MHMKFSASNVNLAVQIVSTPYVHGDLHYLHVRYHTTKAKPTMEMESTLTWFNGNLI